MIFSILKSLALGAWIGALIMFGIAVAGPVFRESPSKTIAGNINGIILSRMNTIEWICGGLALASAIILLIMHWQDATKIKRLIETSLIALALLVLSYYSLSITSRINDLRATIKDFDHPQQTTEYLAAKEEFDVLHKRYTKVVQVNLFIILGSFIFSMMNTKEPS